MDNRTVLSLLSSLHSEGILELIFTFVKLIKIAIIKKKDSKALQSQYTAKKLAVLNSIIP